MKVVPGIVGFSLLLTSLAAAQNAPEPADAVSTAWIQKFDGDWITISRSPDQSVTYKGSMTSRRIGDHWVVNEFRTNMGGFHCHAQQTLGIDQKRNVFTATWVDNALDYKWDYQGTLDEAQKQLVFIAEGPGMSVKGATARYREIYEFQNADRIVTTSQILTDDGDWKTFMSGEMIRKQPDASSVKPSAAPLLMFEGKAERAMKFYVSVFPDSGIEKVLKYVEGENGKAGSIKHAAFRVAGTRLLCIDSPVDHPFEFTPSVSLFVDCESKEQVESIFKKLADGGKVLMPVDDYGFSTRFGWVTDSFGVSWQLNFGALK
nr:VOC family protein [Rhodopirellula sp. SM50]